MSEKRWQFGWASNDYVSGRWQQVTEIREYEPDSDLSDLVAVVTTERASRIMKGEKARSDLAAANATIAARDAYVEQLTADVEYQRSRADAAEAQHVASGQRNIGLMEQLSEARAALTPMEAWVTHAIGVMKDQRLVSSTQIEDGEAVLGMARAALARTPEASQPEQQREGE